MKKPIQISIPTPCHENWATMTPAEKGRFCGMCQKNVHDFTKSSDREIASAFAKEADLCGRFLPSQLERDLFIPKEKSAGWGIAAAVSLLTLGATETTAQTPVQTEQSTQVNEAMVGKVAMPATVVTGTIRDAAGLMPGVVVAIEGSTVTTQTDFDGRYSIEARPGFTLVYSFPGYVSQKQIVDSKTSVIDIILKEENMLDEVVVTGYTTSTRPISGKPVCVLQSVEEKKRTFFGRIFHSIGNLFR
ncbi:carboxypeptidase-like regulatory domain-containing protein [Flavobacterium sp. DGU11]|uniref:Carboxypeptidase-like regulatory domain-containing protein n=1 Tax=Flavobacterium arundinis TaxID=3139143 RepID=A0ABU9HTD4_9FLAO